MNLGDGVGVYGTTPVDDSGDDNGGRLGIRSRLTRNAGERVRDVFGIEPFVDAHLHLYDELLRSRARPEPGGKVA